MNDHEHAHLLLGMARRDLTALTGMMAPALFSPEIFGFHAQQAVEKASKAWLSDLGQEYPRLHDLGELLGTLRSRGIEIPEEFASLDDLTDFAVQYRYEAFEDFGRELNRTEMLDRVRRFVEHVERAIGQQDGTI